MEGEERRYCEEEAGCTIDDDVDHPGDRDPITEIDNRKEGRKKQRRTEGQYI